jgi:tetratricopeptide (TPR) repeat protein
MSFLPHTRVLLTALVLLPIACSKAPELEPLLAPDISTLELVVQEQFTDAWELLENTAALTDHPRVNSENFGQLGRLYLAYGLEDAAEPALVNAARLNPEEYAWAYLLGHLYFSRDPELSASYFEKALAIRDGDIPALVTLGLLQLERGEAESAREVSRRVLDVDPEAAAGYYLGGRASLLIGEYEDAIALLEKALEIQPTADRSYNPLAQAYRALGMVNEATRAQQRAGTGEVSISDDMFGALARLRRGSRADIETGRDALKQGNPEVAISWIEKGLEANPEDAVGWRMMGTALGELGRQAEAREAFEKLLALLPNNTTALVDIGTTYIREGNDLEAIAWYRKAMAKDPDLQKGFLNFANALERTGHCDEALPIYEKAWVYDPSDPGARLGAANCLTAIGYHAQAVHSLEAGVAALPTEPVLFQALAHYLMTTPVPALRDPDRALTLAQQAVDMTPNAPTLATLALAFASTGDFPAAIETQQTAMETARNQGVGEDRLEHLLSVLIVYEAGLLPQNP